MAIESIKAYREVELDIDTDASTTAAFFTEAPGQSMASRHTFTFNTEATTTGRRPINFRLPSEVKGALAKLRITGSGAVRVFGARVLVRYLGGNSPWTWVSLPVEETSPLFGEAALPIEPTSDLFGDVALPIEATPVNRIWVDIPVDAVA